MNDYIWLGGAFGESVPALVSPVPAVKVVLPDEGRRQGDAASAALKATLVARLTEAEIQAAPDGAGESAALDGIEAEFFRGYRDAGGAYGEAHIWRVIDCESLWNPLAGTRHLGLAQFSPGTWANVSGRTGLTDWTAGYDQGYNVAVWASLVSPGTTAGWPTCWNR